MKKSLSSRVTRFTLTPYSFWAMLFIVVPLIFVAYYAFTDSDFNFTTENILRFLPPPLPSAMKTEAGRYIPTLLSSAGL